MDQVSADRISSSVGIDVRDEQMEDDTELRNRLSESVLTEHVVLGDIPLQERPPLPRVPYNMSTQKLTCLMNNVIQEHLGLINGLQDILHWLYIADKTVIVELGIKIEDGRKNKSQRSSTRIPQWKKGKGFNEKLTTCVKKLVLTLPLDNLKQKLAVYANRVRRYTEAALRRHQNQLIKENVRQFYRNLDKKDKPTIQYPDDIEAYWRSVWEKSTCHNENAPWIEEEMRSFVNASEMPEGTITVNDVMETVKNLKNWWASGSDGIQNYWIKRFQSLYQLLANGFQDVLDDKLAPSEGFSYG
ncbi:uncharacterized protein, partial [Halyomorpha halys]